MPTSYGSAGLYFKLEGNLFIADYGTRLVRNATAKTMKEATKIMQGVTPKKTGFLASQWKNSTRSFTDYRQDVLSNTVYYGIFVDEGTRYITARNFVAKGASMIEDVFINNLERELSKLK